MSEEHYYSEQLKKCIGRHDTVDSKTIYFKNGSTELQDHYISKRKKQQHQQQQ